MIYNESLLALFQIGPLEITVLATLGLLIFGNRLPEVGKSLGRGIVEFKKGIRGVTDEIDSASETEDKTDSKKKLNP